MTRIDYSFSVILIPPKKPHLPVGQNSPALDYQTRLFLHPTKAVLLLDWHLLLTCLSATPTPAIAWLCGPPWSEGNTAKSMFLSKSYLISAALSRTILYINVNLKVLSKNGGVCVKKNLSNWWLYSPHVKEFKTVLDSGFHAADSGFLVLDSGFFVSQLEISKSCC